MLQHISGKWMLPLHFLPGPLASPLAPFPHVALARQLPMLQPCRLLLTAWHAHAVALAMMVLVLLWRGLRVRPQQPQLPLPRRLYLAIETEIPHVKHRRRERAR